MYMWFMTTLFVWVLQNVQLHMQIKFELLLIGDKDLSVIYLIVLRWLTWLPEVFCNVHSNSNHWLDAAATDG